jgi:hypothetical protein
MGIGSPKEFEIKSTNPTAMKQSNRARHGPTKNEADIASSKKLFSRQGTAHPRSNARD